jgi:hypothetical protein
LRRRRDVAREIRVARADGEPTAVGTNYGHSDARWAPVDYSSEALFQAHVRDSHFRCVRGSLQVAIRSSRAARWALFLSIFGHSDKYSAWKLLSSVVLNPMRE